MERALRVQCEVGDREDWEQVGDFGQGDVGKAQDLRHEFELCLKRDGEAVGVQKPLETDGVFNVTGDDEPLIEFDVILDDDILLDEGEVNVLARDALTGLVLSFGALCLHELEGRLGFLALVHHSQHRYIVQVLNLHGRLVDYLGQTLYFGSGL